jgi:hypothetical protein
MVSETIVDQSYGVASMAAAAAAWQDVAGAGSRGTFRGARLSSTFARGGGGSLRGTKVVLS